MSSQVHICIVSEQLLPNLIAILAEQPRSVCLVVTEDMHRRGRDQRLREILQARDIEVVSMDADGAAFAPSAGLDQLMAWGGELTAWLQARFPGQPLVLNATGGNKLISIALIQVFLRDVPGQQLRILYTDTAHNQTEQIAPGGQPPQPLPSVLDVPTYLAAQGMVDLRAESDDPEWLGHNEGCRRLASWLASLGERNKLLGVMNYYCLQATGGQAELQQADHCLKDVPYGLWSDILQACVDAGLLRWQPGSAEFSFVSAAAARFLGGGWLEVHAWQLAREAGIHSLACGLTGSWQRNQGFQPVNEFDLVCVHNNRLLLIECKTGDIAAQDSQHRQALVHKLETLGRNAGGLFGQTLLLSVRAPGESVTSRCQAQGIGYLYGNHLQYLAQWLAHWREQGSLPLG